MLVNVLITTLICNTLAYIDREYTPNVGTVLFSTEDMEKEQWTKSEVSLLRARRYFQTIIPPLDFINTFNEDYINILLEYFRDTYSNIKREATDVETDSIMTTALSDVVGGYLKVWVLPVAKLDFYGGTISQDNIIKLFLFYDEIKRYLETDGDGWRCPDENVLNSITINIAPSKLVSNTRSIKDPCDQLAYFEKTSDGLDIPLPQINWNAKASTMFVPLKNLSLIPMNDPNTPSTLIKYYDTAKSCITSTKPAEVDRFESRFQGWLSKEILPHLKDDDVYLALGSVLALVNKTNAACKEVIKQCSEKCHTKCKIRHKWFPFEITSKKMLIIFIILLIEIAWCIPALIYIICRRKKDCGSNVYLFIDQSKPEKKEKTCFGRKTKLTKNVQVDPRPTSFQDIETQNPSMSPCNRGTAISTSKLYYAKHHIVSNMQTQCPSKRITNMGTGSRSYFSSKNQGCDATCVEYVHTTKKSAMKKTKDSQAQPTYVGQMTSISKDDCYRSEVAQEHNTNKETKKSTPKKSTRTKDPKTTSSSKGNDRNIESKNVPAVKRTDQNKDSRVTSSKHNDKHKEPVIITLKPNNLNYDSKSASLKLSEPSQDSKTSSIKRKESTQDQKTYSIRHDEISRDSETYYTNDTPPNRNSNTASLSRQSHQSRDLMSVSQSYTKSSSRGKDDKICELIEVQSINIEIPSPSDSGTTKVGDSRMFDIEEELICHHNPADVAPICSCTACLRGTHIVQEITSGSVPEIELQVHEGHSKEIMVTEPCCIEEKTTYQTCKEQNARKSKKASFRVDDRGKPFFEITIDRPATSISVDVTASQQIKTICTPKKRSRIPKPSANVQQALLSRMPGHQAQSIHPASSERPRSMIPQLKKRTVDDISLGQCCCPVTRNKLNDTF